MLNSMEESINEKYKKLNKGENFVISKIFYSTDVDDCYFFMPDNDCLTYFLNDLILCLKNQINGDVSNKIHLHEMFEYFHSFLENDYILSSIDSLAFSSLLLLVKDLKEGKDYNKKELLEKLEIYRNRYSNSYLYTVVKNITINISDDNFQMEKVSDLLDLFINELLARGYDIRFINKSAALFINGRFASLDAFFDFFTRKDNISCDIYLPIINYKTSNAAIFKAKDQEIIEKDGNYFLHVFQNNIIDYFSIIKKQMVRIDSIFNMLKLYSKSKIDFDFTKSILVKSYSPYLIDSEIPFEISFSSIINFEGLKCFSKFLDNTITNLESLSYRDEETYHKILNIIAYAEKDNSIINPSSYVDYWISTESLYSLIASCKGYEAVKNLLPKMLISKFLTNKSTFLLKKCYKDYMLEDFISDATNGCAKKTFINNEFLKFEIKKLEKNLSSIKDLKCCFDSIEKLLRKDLLRIYLLRNEYVHQSNLSAFRSLQLFKVKNYLTISLDIFFGTLDDIINNSHYSGPNLMEKINSKISEKFENRDNLFKITLERHTYLNKTKQLTIKELDSKIELKDIIANIIFGRTCLTSKFYH